MSAVVPTADKTSKTSLLLTMCEREPELTIHRAPEERRRGNETNVHVFRGKVQERKEEAHT